MAAYVLTKYNFKFKNVIYALFTITLLVPAHARTQSIFSLIYKLNLYDTKGSLILVYISLGMALSIFILKASFIAVPKSLDEAALIDGASIFKKFTTINLPLAKGWDCYSWYVNVSCKLE
ncbi:MAG: ABC transporter permease subunit [Lachnospirales bacterium]